MIWPAQIVKHLRSYLKDNPEVVNVLQYTRDNWRNSFIRRCRRTIGKRRLARCHCKQGFHEAQAAGVYSTGDEPIHDFRHRPADVTKIAQMIFGGFSRCLYPVQKFQSDTERVLSIILDQKRRSGSSPVGVSFKFSTNGEPTNANTSPTLSPKRRTPFTCWSPKCGKTWKMAGRAKKDSAVRWCRMATDHSGKNGGETLELLAHPARCDCREHKDTLNGLGARILNELGSAAVTPVAERSLPNNSPSLFYIRHVTSNGNIDDVEAHDEDQAQAFRRSEGAELTIADFFRARWFWCIYKPVSCFSLFCDR